jgi:hypothetical protein
MIIPHPFNSHGCLKFLKGVPLQTLYDLNTFSMVSTGNPRAYRVWMPFW